MTSPLLDFSVDSLEFAIELYMQKNDKKLRFCILHADNSVELILKELVRHHRSSIYTTNGKTIDFHKSINILKSTHNVAIPEQSDLELVHDQRNLIQHKGANVTSKEAEFYLYTVYYFLERILKDELNLDIANIIDTRYYTLFHKPGISTPKISKKVSKKKRKAKPTKISPKKPIKTSPFKSTSVSLDYFNAITNTEQLKNLVRQGELLKKSIPQDELSKIVVNVDRLSKLKIVDKPIVDAYKSVVDFRNKLVHSDYLPTQKEFKNIQQNYEKVTSELQKSLAKLKSSFAINDVIIPKLSNLPQSGKGFQPKTLTIRKGEFVKWINNDNVIHVIASGTPADGPDSIFDSSSLSPKAIFYFKFEKQGTFNYFDIINPWLNGSIIVKP